MVCRMLRLEIFNWGETPASGDEALPVVVRSLVCYFTTVYKSSEKFLCSSAATGYVQHVSAQCNCRFLQLDQWSRGRNDFIKRYKRNPFYRVIFWLSTQRINQTIWNSNEELKRKQYVTVNCTVKTPSHHSSRELEIQSREKTWTLSGCNPRSFHSNSHLRLMDTPLLVVVRKTPSCLSAQNPSLSSDPST